jgi:hypothetical protein
VEHAAPPLLLDPLLDPLLLELLLLELPLLEPPLLELLLLELLLLPPPLLLPEVLPLDVPVQHWMSSGPGHSPAVDLPPCAVHAEVAMHCPDSPFAVHEPYVVVPPPVLPPVVGPSGVDDPTTATWMRAWSPHPSSDPNRYMMVGYETSSTQKPASFSTVQDGPLSSTITTTDLPLAGLVTWSRAPQP